MDVYHGSDGKAEHINKIESEVESVAQKTFQRFEERQRQRQCGEDKDYDRHAVVGGYHNGNAVGHGCHHQSYAHRRSLAPETASTGFFGNLRLCYLAFIDRCLGRQEFAEHHLAEKDYEN